MEECKGSDVFVRGYDTTSSVASKVMFPEGLVHVMVVSCRAAESGNFVAVPRLVSRGFGAGTGTEKRGVDPGRDVLAAFCGGISARDAGLPSTTLRTCCRSGSVT